MDAPDFEPRYQSWLARFCVAGCLFLAVISLRMTPAPRLWLGKETTPFDNGPVRSVAAAFALLQTAATVVPRGAAVVALQVPESTRANTYFHRAAVALLPGRHVLPAALWFVQATTLENQADYVIILGPVDNYPGFTVMLRTGSGSIWRRKTS